MWKHHDEGGPFAQVAMDRNGPAVQADDFADDGQAEAGAA